MKSIKTYIYAILLVYLSAVTGAWAQSTLSGNVATTVYYTGTLTLTGNVTLSAAGAIGVSVGETLTIDLNGYNITGNGGHLLVCNANSTLIVNNSRVVANGGIISGGSGDRGGCIFVSGKFYFNGGTIRNCVTNRSYGTGYAVEGTPDENAYTKGAGGAVYVSEGGYFEMNDGATITECSTELTTTMSTYTNTKATTTNKEFTVWGRGGAVFLDAEHGNTRFVMNGGTISNCKSGAGGAVYVHAPLVAGNSGKAEFIMNGGVISGCQSLYAHKPNANNKVYERPGGGAVYVGSGELTKNKANLSVFRMHGGVIEGCQAAYHGCAVMVRGEMEMTGGIIEDNYPYAWASNLVYPTTHSGSVYGGGIYVIGSATAGQEENWGKLYMRGGTIQNNMAASGGGVMAWENSYFEMNGAEAKISACQALGEGGLGNGGAVYVQTATFRFVNGTLSGNKAVRYGGAVNINQSATFTLEGACKILGNMADIGGGALSQEQGKCNMTLDHSEILIQGNKVGRDGVVGNGGGIFIEKGEFIVNAGTIKDNTATGSGGGASLRVERIVGDMLVRISGGEISGNSAGNTGGGIDLYADRNYVTGGGVENTDNGANHKNDVDAYLISGYIMGNNAQRGGAINIHINEANSLASMTLGDALDMGKKPVLDGNFAFERPDGTTGEGGAVYMSAGSVTVHNGELKNNYSANNGGAVYLGNGSFTVKYCNLVGNSSTTADGGAIYINKGDFSVLTGGNAQFWDNKALQGNGGAIAIQSGNFTVDGETNIRNNEAVDGGGVFVQGGTVGIAEGTIQKNRASELGGGLYVYNSGAQKNVTFSGGTFSQNEAKAGGGLCAIGNLNLEIDATIESNVAINGGGIYMADGVQMNFGEGLIRSNYARKTDETVVQTAFQKTYADVQGVGGGLFLANNCSLKFSSTEMGIYNNRADNAADDICANGTNTNVALPAINNMTLREFDVPTNQLYWVEDYAANDIGYAMGTKLNTSAAPEITRYQDALRKVLEVYHLNETPVNQLPDAAQKYLCLSLGYELVFVLIIKEGLEENDDATFVISNPVSEGSTDFEPYRRIIFFGKGAGADKAVKKIVALPSGYWRIQESEWSWKYELPTEEDFIYEKVPGHREDCIYITRNHNKTITIKNKYKTETPDGTPMKDIREFETHKVNHLIP